MTGDILLVDGCSACGRAPGAFERVCAPRIWARAGDRLFVVNGLPLLAVPAVRARQFCRTFHKRKSRLTHSGWNRWHQTCRVSRCSCCIPILTKKLLCFESRLCLMSTGLHVGEIPRPGWLRHATVKLARHGQVEEHRSHSSRKVCTRFGNLYHLFYVLSTRVCLRAFSYPAILPRRVLAVDRVLRTFSLCLCGLSELLVGNRYRYRR